MDSPNIAKRIEIASNIAIIGVGVLLAVFLVKNLFFSSKDTSMPNRLPVSGTKLQLADSSWAKYQQTVLLVLKEDCHFCSESAPFYQRLAQALASENEMQLVAVLPEEVGVGRAYLKKLDVSVNEIRQCSLDSLGVGGTPALIVTDSEGRVTSSWLGKLTPDKESEVMSRLKCKECGK